MEKISTFKWHQIPDVTWKSDPASRQSDCKVKFTIGKGAFMLWIVILLLKKSEKILGNKSKIIKIKNLLTWPEWATYNFKYHIQNKNISTKIIGKNSVFFNW